ncbi:MAG: TlyA family RNA methyltransferase [Acidimicrobiia bacterium]
MTRRRLDAELVRRKLVRSRTEAQRAIDAGLVRVGTNPSPKAATMVAPDEALHVVAPPEPFVSRAGRKLDGALDLFGVETKDREAVDVGASTGGFTDCLLQRGAESVVAVDVGYGQIDWSLREDDRVTVVERTNIRLADINALGAPFDVVVADLSFISLQTVAHALRALGDTGTDWILLIKPQFEAGKERVGKGGIVRDPEVWRDVLVAVTEALASEGLGCHGLAVSSISGTQGNKEFVGHFTTGPQVVVALDIDSVVEEAS